MRLLDRIGLNSLIVIWSCAGCMIAVAHADDAKDVSDAAVRDAVSRSLIFLETEGVAWMRDRGCASCHHVPFLLWSHRAAQAHGLDVDLTKLADWDEWTRNDSLSHRNLYRLQDYELGKVDATMLPDSVREKLKPLIELPFKTEQEFLAKLATLLTEDERKSFQDIVAKTAERTPYSVDRTGGGLDVLGQLLFSSQGTTSVLTQTEFREWLATRLLFEREFGSVDDVDKWRQLLLESRNMDGGWGWEKGVASDSMTTGLAIYVLAKTMAGDDFPAIQAARSFLLKSQQSDGSWLTPSKNITKSTDPERLRVRDEIYHYWGTAWSAIGLLETLGKPGN